MTGLVVEGGASRTYFSVGVMDAMMEAGIPIDYITGASAGISNAMNYASNQPGRGIAIGEGYVPKKEYSGARHLLNPRNRSLYNISYVFDRIPNELVPYDYDAFERFSGYAEAAVTNMETGKAEYIRIQNPRRGWNVLVASCSLPLMFPAARINGKRYMDGGIADSIPFERALEVGCTRTIVILSREREYVKSEGKGELISAKLFARYPAFAKALKNRSTMYNNQREELFRLEKEGKVFVIAPKDTKNWKRTENDGARIRSMYDEGLTLGRELVPELVKYINAKEV